MTALSPALEFRLRDYGDLDPAAVRWLRISELKKRRMQETDAHRRKVYWTDNACATVALLLSYALDQRTETVFLVFSVILLVWWIRIGTATFYLLLGRDRDELLIDPVFERRRCYFFTTALLLLYLMDTLGPFANQTVMARVLLMGHSVRATAAEIPWLIPAVCATVWGLQTIWMECSSCKYDKVIEDKDDYDKPEPSSRLRFPGQ
ncbi:hypothetical protein OH77DRAFT_1434717 [Trametes cingulata]|nr:hypothetical protein OH77DRAFT_1434717 [Trametes cingulata]